MLTESAPIVPPAPPADSTIDLIVSRAASLYTLPAVAVQVLQLIEQPTADVRALKECLQQDPALTAKVLRVVNSSLFGLSHSVGDLNEAVALLGLRAAQAAGAGLQLARTVVSRHRRPAARLVLALDACPRGGRPRGERAAVQATRATRRSSRACCRTSACWCCCESSGRRMRSWFRR